MLSVTGSELTVCENNSALLGHYAPSIGNFVPTFRGDLSVPSSGVKNKKKRRAAIHTSQQKPKITHGVCFIDRCQ